MALVYEREIWFLTFTMGWKM